MKKDVWTKAASDLGLDIGIYCMRGPPRGKKKALTSSLQQRRCPANL
jgi:hypothetical protein